MLQSIQKYFKIDRSSKGILLVVMLFVFTIPAEYYEIFTLLENQTRSFRQIMRTTFGDHKSVTFPYDKITFANIDEEFFEGYGRARDLSDEAMIRRAMYIIVEIVKYPFIRAARNNNPGAAEHYKRQIDGLVREYL